MNRRGSVRNISGNKNFIEMKKRRNVKNVQIYLIESCNRAVICENDISLVDLETKSIIARFTPDTPVSLFFVSLFSVSLFFVSLYFCKFVSVSLLFVGFYC